MTASLPGRCTQSYTPNVLMGDVFYIDTASQGGNISGDQAIAIEFSPFLDFSDEFSAGFPVLKTFFGKFVSTSGCNAELTGTGCVTLGVPPALHLLG